MAAPFKRASLASLYHSLRALLHLHAKIKLPCPMDLHNTIAFFSFTPSPFHSLQSSWHWGLWVWNAGLSVLKFYQPHLVLREQRRKSRKSLCNGLPSMYVSWKNNQIFHTRSPILWASTICYDSIIYYLFRQIYALLRRRKREGEKPHPSTYNHKPAQMPIANILMKYVTFIIMEER